jgi:hypothetical protein
MSAAEKFAAVTDRRYKAARRNPRGLFFWQSALTCGGCKS